MKKAKRIIALIMVAILSLGIVAACAADEPEPPPVETPPAEETTTDPSAEPVVTP